MRKLVVMTAVSSAALLAPNVASAHLISLGKSPQKRAAMQKRVCQGNLTTVKQFRRYASRVYKRDKISKRAKRRIRMMHICQDTFKQRITVGRWHAKYVKARANRNAYSPVGGILYAIRLCESGNNYSTNTGNGFYGAYQFTLGTWQAYGGSGYPHLASPAEQDRVAANLYRAVGTHTTASWPNCP